MAVFESGPNLLPATHFKGLSPTPADTTLKLSTALPHCTITMPVQRSLQPPNKAFHTEMPNPIPYFIVALDGYEHKDDLYALAIEIRDA
ncbi:hypothetical protein FOQG_18837 [Fusarium oxysporum f. sp. raphani 54005]|uniref:Uncharacterized protein n=1 Tax=Fusarium oxysporum f. sp. raphani 54005 TaxID=1089458 RepID=X0B2S0_FUSOX|nr:hypothetical protein FOQG_18837 [Fusarium oxysporum f. sp. raphani 54005]